MKNMSVSSARSCRVDLQHSRHHIDTPTWVNQVITQLTIDIWFARTAELVKGPTDKQPLQTSNTSRCLVATPTSWLLRKLATATPTNKTRCTFSSHKSYGKRRKVPAVALASLLVASLGRWRSLCCTYSWQINFQTQTRRAKICTSDGSHDLC